MSRSFFSTTGSFRLAGSLFILVLSLASASAQQTGEARRPSLDLEGNKVFAKAILLDKVNSQLDAWAKNGGTYEPNMLNYCVHQLEMFMRSHGYLQAKVTRGISSKPKPGRGYFSP